MGVPYNSSLASKNDLEASNSSPPAPDSHNVVETQSMINQPIGAQPGVDTRSLVGNTGRESAKAKQAQRKFKLTKQLNDVIDLQLQINQALTNEIKGPVSYERLELVVADLSASLKFICSLHNELKTVETQPDKSIVRLIDQLVHDNQHITRQAEQRMSDMSVRH